ncbi:hypothetical protein M0R45_011140 [Rubus argutus]|uniref:methenyltetrahydrofolate cyclohydrolase n=1 Tax=Rubus argutus TaxID=59490 RepID=A0AAW1YA53_RUBAR
MASQSDHKATIIDGKAIAQTIRSEIAEEVRNLSEIWQGAWIGSSDCGEQEGFPKLYVDLPENVSQDDLIANVHELNVNPDVHGILVQLPLPRHINEEKVLSEISIEKDVDGFHPLNIGKLAMKGREPLFLPCTPKGCLELLSRSGISITGKKAVVVGRNSDPESIIREADIIIAAAGQAMMIKGGWIKPGAAIIDVGTNAIDDSSKRSGYRLVGDVDFQEACKVAGWITPVPGGVGPMTVAMLLKNTLDGAKRVIAQ